MSIEMHALESESTKDDEKEEMASLVQLERCLDACGFGKYQWGLLAVSFLGVLAHACAMVSAPYGPTTVYLGVIFSSFPFGFLSDCFGRRKTNIICYAGLAATVLLKVVMQAHVVTYFALFCQGFFLSGAFAASTALQAEFQTEKSRDRIIITLNFFLSLHQVLIALSGLFIASSTFVSASRKHFFELALWDLATLLSVVLSLVVCLLYAWLPESPKYDFTHGRYKNALETVKRIYSVNTGKSTDEFPYQLLGMSDNELKSWREQIRTTWSDVKCLIKNPLLKFLIIIMAAQFTFAISNDSMKHWHPVLVMVIDHSPGRFPNATNLCAAFENNERRLEIDILRELLHHILNCIIIVAFGLIPYILVTIFINRGKKLIILISLCICCCCIVSLHWIFSVVINTIVFGIFITMGHLLTGVIQAIVVDIFPVWTRSLALSLTLAATAAGGVLAELSISSFIQYGCALAYIVPAMVACAAFLSTFLPK